MVSCKPSKSKNEIHLNDIVIFCGRKMPLFHGEDLVFLKKNADRSNYVKISVKSRNPHGYVDCSNL